MKVVEAFVNKLPRPTSKLIGFANVKISFDGSDDVHLSLFGLKIFRNDKDTWIKMVDRFDEKDQKYYPLVSVNYKSEPGNEFLKMITAAVVTKYNSLGDNSGRAKRNQNNEKPQERISANDISQDDIPF